MIRGEIWWVDLGIPFGSEPGFKRPVLIIQDDSFNQSSISTVVSIAITSNLNLSEAPGNVLISKKESSLSKDSVVNVSQIVTLDKERFIKRAGKLKSSKINEVETGLKLVTGLN
ncbi:type II toxin-antitoxin system PemK/MazF family toxin [Leptospira noguchii]|uniref:mRNA interferase n=1 Tax=Leptospira noguchii TaxID=28182 RepID=A0A9Q8RAW3_9LEPT|nr:type II toxin-antitoxin system PemK/MazF family toxin [Leptospira noguchii]EMO25074.1 PemK-like protein [Leptospira interrogans serovar Bataviae str. HAI135]TQE76533.1 type II toxin-antitoxin system PemK/MazF family toxin [Leptospira noguchii]UOG31074.1 type II toxin-antitoxin system PemK/MazF family toxin [Leptospira noguchii]UOG34722.1 type II toxin-antitoxin system PemK/MazF family toxin [Leptospira noguchii]UOG38382.1 type II toxin-antitoxin system PemK/MazF family toxin [Leptospira nog